MRTAIRPANAERSSRTFAPEIHSQSVPDLSSLPTLMRRSADESVLVVQTSPGRTLGHCLTYLLILGIVLAAAGAAPLAALVGGALALPSVAAPVLSQGSVTMGFTLLAMALTLGLPFVMAVSLESLCRPARYVLDPAGIVVTRPEGNRHLLWGEVTAAERMPIFRLIVLAGAGQERLILNGSGVTTAQWRALENQVRIATGTQA